MVFPASEPTPPEQVAKDSRVAHAVSCPPVACLAALIPPPPRDSSQRPLPLCRAAVPSATPLASPGVPDSSTEAPCGCAAGGPIPAPPAQLGTPLEAASCRVRPVMGRSCRQHGLLVCGAWAGTVHAWTASWCGLQAGLNAMPAQTRACLVCAHPGVTLGAWQHHWLVPT